MVTLTRCLSRSIHLWRLSFAGEDPDLGYPMLYGANITILFHYLNIIQLNFLYLISNKIMEYTELMAIRQERYELAKEIVEFAKKVYKCDTVAELKKECESILSAINLIGE